MTKVTDTINETNSNKKQDKTSGKGKGKGKEVIVNEYDSIGKVIKCESLNIRKEPKEGSSVESILKRFDIVSINSSRSTEDFYAIKIGSIEGFCKKDFIGIE